MKKIIDDERVILRVCDLYYNYDKKQSDIAKELGISRPTVSRMLSMAKEKGIVKIIISDLSGRSYFELERKIEEKFDLKCVIIVSKKNDAFEQKDEIGKATAEYLTRIVKEGSVVGVSMGTTLTHVAKFIDSRIYYRKLMFVPLLGGVGQIETELHSNYVAESLAKKFGGRSILFHSPAVVSRFETKEALLNEDSIKRVFKKIENLDIAIVGIGTLHNDSTILKAGYYSEKLLKELKENGAVGDICLRFFDKYGDSSHMEINDNVVGVSLNRLKTVPYSIGVACGIEKADSIIGALKGKLVNVLIIDEECAQEVYRKM